MKSRTVMMGAGALAILALAEGCLAAAVVYPKARITLQVNDDEGKPVIGMPVAIGFVGEGVKGVTDGSGQFIFEGPAETWDLYYTLEEKGWYTTDSKYPFEMDEEGGRMLPWNPVVTAVVRRVVNPIPMYAKRVETRIPTEGTAVGFDLEVGDWVDPHGVGKSADFVFRLTRRITAPDDYEGSLRVSVLNSGDGIAKIDRAFSSSQFKHPREAPAEGYATNYLQQVGRQPGAGRYGAKVDDPTEYYFYRVRSRVIDGTGEMTALYGKLAGRIEFTGVLATNLPRVSFTYYLNPTPNDRNLEFDPKRNLFKKLKSMEEVRDP